MPTAASSFPAWLDALPKWHGFHRISPERPYAHAEEQYDAQYGVSAPEPEEGQGLCALLARHGVDTRGPGLEIGCGTGRLTYGLVRHYPGPDFLVTDPSPAFLRLTAAQFPAGEKFPTRPHFALLNADDLGQLPPDMFSLIAMRSTLHHILDVEGFMAACARTLRPGGALAMGAEPVQSGYLLMAMVTQSIAPTLEAAGVKLRPEWRQQLRTFTDTVKFYCRRDIDKTKAEDKHLFQVHDLADLGHRLGLHLRFFPNATFGDFAPPFLPAFESFTVFYMNYLQFCMLFDAELLQLIRQHLKGQLDYLDDCHRDHVGPVITGVFLLQKSGAKS
jgi:SAM-dependent methyltransferase